MASQESWKMGEEGTGSRQSQVPDRPIHCLNNCGFFGSAATMNLCSKCYKELTLSSSSLLASKLPATEPASAAAANNIEAASITVASSSKSMEVENKKKPTNPTIEPASSAASSKSIKIEAEGGSCEESGGGRVRKGKETDVLEEEEEEEPRRRNKNRCYSCHKRVGLTGFKCRCGDLFCAQHRYSDMHNCTFDYKTAARLAIQMANPVVKAPKIHKI